MDDIVLAANIAANVSPIHKRMTQEDYDSERARLHGLYGDSRKEAGARYEQALARLFNLSGWTLNELAVREGKGKRCINQLLVFGRFILFLTLGTTVPKPENGTFNLDSSVPLGLTERRFRGFWQQTEEHASGSSGGNEHIRFRRVMRLMEEEAAAPKVKTHQGRDIGKAIAAHFSDGKWHDIQVIAKKLQTPIEDIRPVLETIRQHRTFNCSAEKKEVARTWHWRIFPLERQISTVEIAEKLAEPLKELAEQGRANTATMSPATVAFYTAMIRQQVSDWIGRPPKTKK
jgi:hypothetical protein